MVSQWLAELGLQIPRSVLGLAPPSPPGHGGRFVGTGAVPPIQLLPPLGPRRVPHYLSEEDCVFKNKIFNGRKRHTLHVYSFTSWFSQQLWEQTQSRKLGIQRGVTKECIGITKALGMTEVPLQNGNDNVRGKLPNPVVKPKPEQ